LHRTASACAVPAENHAVVYQLFHESEGQAWEQAHYDRDMEFLHDLVCPSDNLRFGMESMIKLVPTRGHEDVANKMKDAECAEIPDLIRNTLATRSLFEFSSICFSTWDNE